MRIIRFSDLIESPWKNGGGVTREIAGERRDGALVWRLSMADVAADGPFSDFTGLTRILTVIDGGGMVLAGPAETLVADLAVPVTFDGATPITSTLTDGPLRDLNLMFDPSLCTGTVTPLHGPRKTTHPAMSGGTLGVHCIHGPVTIGAGTELTPGDTALITGAAVDLDLTEGACALLIDLRPPQTEASSSAIETR